MLFNLICAVPYGTLPTVMWIETSDCMPWSPWAYTGLDIDIDMASKVAPVAAPKAKATSATLAADHCRNLQKRGQMSEASSYRVIPGADAPPAA